ncbi:MAG: DUF4179 domain-containing protein [Oscillospiraceae bacterium]|nr:DUF4179 domain-containing protein [Oscillospiraceae bacterium]
MYNSERMMKAIGDISDDKIEKTGRALGYQREQRRISPISIRMGRLLSIAAVVALIFALGMTAYAIYTHWSRGMEQRLPATEEEKEMAELSGLSDTSQTVSAIANGVTISVEQTVIDRETAHIALRIEGFMLPEGQYPDIGDWSLTFDGENAPSMTGGFVEERDANDKLIFTAPDGSMEFDFTAKAGGKWESFEGKEVRLVINNLGTGDKAQYQALVEGPWELVWTPSSSSELLTVQPDTYIGDSGVKLIKAEVSPISAKVTLQLPELWEGYKTLEDYDLQLVGVCLKDGTKHADIYTYPMQVEYVDIDNLILELDYSAHQILQPKQVDALIFASNSPWARTLTDSDLILVPID